MPEPTDPQRLELVARQCFSILSGGPRMPLYRRLSFTPEHTTLGGRVQDQRQLDPADCVLWDEDSFVKRVFSHFRQYGSDYKNAMGNYARWVLRDPPENTNHLLSIEHMASAVVWSYFWGDETDNLDHWSEEEIFERARRRLERERRQKEELERLKQHHE